MFGVQMVWGVDRDDVHIGTGEHRGVVGGEEEVGEFVARRGEFLLAEVAAGDGIGSGAAVQCEQERAAFVQADDADALTVGMGLGRG